MPFYYKSRSYLLQLKSYIKLIAVLSVVFACCGLAEADESSPSKLHVPDSLHIQIISFNDGSELIGRITVVTDNQIIFKSSLGETPIEIAKIRDIREIWLSSLREGKYWFPSPNQTRLYFSQTGRMLKQGQWYFSDFYIFFPGFSYGISDNITLGGGMSIFPGVDFGDQAFFFTPKIGISTSEKANFAVGALVISIPTDIGDEDIPTFGLVYGVGTFGSPDASFSAGLGYGFAGDKVANKPAVMLGGDFRLGRRLSFVSENWIFPHVDNPLVSYGFRFFGDKLCVDLGLINTLGDDATFPGYPWIDFVVNIR